MVFWCHLGNAVEKTAVILSHLYVIGVKIVLRANGMQTFFFVLQSNNCKINVYHAYKKGTMKL